MSKLIKQLKSIGKAVFVEYYDIFKAYGHGNMSKENCIELLISENVSNDSGAAIRCSYAILIFKANMQREALKIITGSRRLSSKTITDATILLSVECK